MSPVAIVILVIAVVSLVLAIVQNGIANPSYLILFAIWLTVFTGTAWTLWK